MNLPIETLTRIDGARMDVIRDIEKVTRIIDAAEHIAARLRLWKVSDGEMLCSEDAEALKAWDALTAPDQKRAENHNA